MPVHPPRGVSRSRPRRLFFPALGGALSAGSAGVLIVLIGTVIDRAVGGKPLTWQLIAAIITCILVGAIAEGLHRQRQLEATSQDEAPLRMRLVSALLRRGPASIQRSRSGDYVSLATDGVERVARYTGGFTNDLVAAAANPVVLLAIIGIIIDPLAALLLAGGVLLGMGIIKWFSDTHRDVGAQSRRARGRVATAYLDAIQGLETLALLRATDRIGAQLAEMGERQRQATMRLLARNQQLLLVIDIVVSTVLTAGACALAAWGLSLGHMTLGQAGALIALTIIMIEPLEMVGSFFYIAMAGRAIGRRISGVIAHAGHIPMPRTRIPDHLPTVAPRVSAHDLHYTYPDAGSPSLQPFSLTVEAGEHVAIKGRSGTGKSTLLALIDGDLELQGGALEIGKHQFTSQHDDRMARRFTCAVVTQDSWLFTGTVRDNLRIGAPNASEDEMWAALEDAFVASEIRALPGGLDTQVGERGGMLSGGQIQRLALARAFLSGRKLLVLDEPTSQIDKNSEANIMRALERAGRDLTIIMATHRESSTGGFDRIITLGDTDETP